MVPLKIDAHTHIVTHAIKDAYFSRTDGYAIVMPFLDKFIAQGYQDESLAVVRSDPRLFLSPTIDLSKPIAPQLEVIDSIMDEKVVGLKVFLTYQRGRADDEKMWPIYDFAQAHRLTLTYHTGSCALELASDNDLAGSNAAFIKNVALRYPDVNFVVAHMDDPRYDPCIRLMEGMDNMFTDFSGAYEPGTHEGSDMDWAIATFAKAIHQRPDTYRQILYGTDFCPPIHLSAIEEYDVTIARLFPREQFADIYYNNALRAFPKIKNYIEANAHDKV